MNCAALSRLTAPQPKTARYLTKAILAGMMLICIMSVSACGKKAAHVDPPEGSEGNYPATYPDPKTTTP
ncbi:MAG: hypothetical protein WCD70_11615 [Alphaproteobacteria bacterium]